jgi:hypothetical protein
VEALGFLFFALFLDFILCGCVDSLQCIYFSAAGLALALAAGLALVCSDTRSSRVLNLLAALERLRVFLRALALDLGMKSNSPQFSGSKIVS